MRGVAMGLAFALLAAGARAQPAARFELHAQATLGADVPVQRGGRFRLQAQVSAQAAAPVLAPQALIGGSFVLNALASASSLVCYDDTIFRDDFDGDGF